MAKLSSIEGIGEVYALKLKEAGVGSVEKLLEVGATARGRKELAQKTGLSETQILNWVNRADLTRIKGVNTQYADLLEAAGVDSVPELAQRNPENLYAKLVETNEVKKLVRKLPTAAQVKKWVEQAKELPRIVTH